MDAREYLMQLIYTKHEVDDWLDGREFRFACYDGKLGWLLNDGRVAYGVDGSTSIYHYDGPAGARRMINYADEPCRINTYGDSFTQCHQVSDGETWQEVLAGHLGEPVRNFGIGGWSVYQAYLRMLQTEPQTPADVIILNIYDDDHYRNLDAWRTIRVRKHPRFIEPPLPHISANSETEEFIERANPCPSADSLYDLCDLDKVCEMFDDDFVLGIMLAHANAAEGNPHADYSRISNQAATHGIATRIDSAETLSAASADLHTRSALYATQRIVEAVEDFAQAAGKQVLYVLSFNAAIVVKYLTEQTRFDQPFVDFLRARKLPVVDLLEAHAADFAAFKLSPADYVKRYYIGHYSPAGNHFEAFAIKDQLVEMLSPKPIAYQPE